MGEVDKEDEEESDDRLEEPEAPTFYEFRT